MSTHKRWCATQVVIPQGAVAERGPCNCGATKLKPSGYVPTWEETPEKFKSRMKRRIAQAAEKATQSKEQGSATAPVLPVENRVPSLSGTPSFHSTNPITSLSGIGNFSEE